MCQGKDATQGGRFAYCELGCQVYYTMENMGARESNESSSYRHGFRSVDAESEYQPG